MAVYTEHFIGGVSNDPEIAGNWAGDGVTDGDECVIDDYAQDLQGGTLNDAAHAENGVDVWDVSSRYRFNIGTAGDPLICDLSATGIVHHAGLGDFHWQGDNSAGAGDIVVDTKGKLFANITAGGIARCFVQDGDLELVALMAGTLARLHWAPRSLSTLTLQNGVTVTSLRCMGGYVNTAGTVDLGDVLIGDGCTFTHGLYGTMTAKIVRGGVLQYESNGTLNVEVFRGGELRLDRDALSVTAPRALTVNIYQHPGAKIYLGNTQRLTLTGSYFMDRANVFQTGGPNLGNYRGT